MIMDQLDVHPRIIEALKNAKLFDIKRILCMSAPDIGRMTRLSASDVTILHKAIAQAIPRTPSTTAFDLLNEKAHPDLHLKRLSTGCKVIDSFLEGGFLARGITEIAGESASGKTQLCMQLCLTVQLSADLGGLGSGALYVCTEDVFPNKRLYQMAVHFARRRHLPHERLTDNVFIEHAADLEDLRFCLTRKAPLLLSRGGARLIVVDSIAALFRCEFGARDAVRRAKELSAFGYQLHKLSHQFGVPVVCVNQVSAVVNKTYVHTDASNDRTVVPALGIAWANLVTTRLLLSRTNATVSVDNYQGAQQRPERQTLTVPVRTMEVAFAPHLPTTSCNFIVDPEGVKGLD